LSFVTVETRDLSIGSETLLDARSQIGPFLRPTRDTRKPIRKPMTETRGYKRANIEGNFHEVMNYTVLEWSDGHALIEMQVLPKHRNRGASIHGGVIAALIDIAADMGGTWRPEEEGGERRTVTVNLNVNFIGGTGADIVHARGWRSHATRNTLFSNAEIFEPDTGKLLANGQGVYKFLRDGTDYGPGATPGATPEQKAEEKA
jgi:uncharacterized protein (TIGR00369 family)